MIIIHPEEHERNNETWSFFFLDDVGRRGMFGTMTFLAHGETRWTVC
jgi:hypothetical protein